MYLPFIITAHRAIDLEGMQALTSATEKSLVRHIISLGQFWGKKIFLYFFMVALKWSAIVNLIKQLYCASPRKHHSYGPLDPPLWADSHFGIDPRLVICFSRRRCYTF